MPTYSHSRLETFETCPQKYKFQYIDRIKKPEEQAVEAFVGSQVHETLQKLHKDLQLTKLNTLDELLEFYRQQWKANWSPAIKIVREGYSEQHYFGYGAQCIRNYYAQYAPFDQSQTLRTEAHISFPLDGNGKYQIQGYIDRIAKRPDGTYEIHDYKTSQYLPSQAIVNADRQLGLYQMGLSTMWPDVERVELIWHFVGFSSTLRSTRQSEELTELRESTIELIHRIELEKEFPPHKSVLCDWCEYHSHCPLWRHVEYVETLTPEELKANDTVQMVDQYARAKAEMHLLQGRIEQLKERLVATAQEQKVLALQGTRARVTIRTREWDSFPGKNDDGRPELEEFVRGAGKWDEVSQLDVRALTGVLEGQDWPPKLLEKLREFTTRKFSTSVYLSEKDTIEEDEGT